MAVFCVLIFFYFLMSQPYISPKVVQEAYTFDDVLLIPNYANFYRTEISLAVTLHPKIQLSLPVISSPMDTVTDGVAAAAMANNGGLGVIHRAFSPEVQAEQVALVKSTSVATPHNDQNRTAAVDAHGKLLVAAAMGVDAEFDERLTQLVAAGVDLIVLDTAHGHAQYIMDGILKIKKAYPDMPVMAGNITTAEAATDLIAAGADILRVGMGAGSICTTRIVTGMGVPQLTAVENVAKVAREKGVAVVADGGIKQIGDMSKALGFGADAVMLGSMLAGFDQSPGETVTVDGKEYKTVRGMGSVAAMTQTGGGRYGQKTKESKKLVAEGVSGLVRMKGDVQDFLYQIAGGIAGSYYYVGAKTGAEFYQKSRFSKITAASMKESHPHSMSMTDGGASYQK